MVRSSRNVPSADPDINALSRNREQDILAEQGTNYATRDPSVCAGCSCFILDARHKGFWEDRFKQSWFIWQQAERMGFSEQFRVIRERAFQAKALLMRIGVDVNELERQVEAEMLECDDAT